ncbi:MAG: TRAP transporter large permease [Alphaproteobacteria bacterium]|nr:TRAP transporter large permease [Alphaproteobacteria bacterium]
MISILGIAIGFGFMLLIMLAGLHVATTLFATAALGSWWYFGGTMFQPLGTMMWGTLNNFILVSIPLYILMGELLVRGGVTERMYVALADWLHPLPGSLLHTNIAASTLFASISGSSVATAATIGTVALPSFRKRGYEEKWVLGSVASGATLGILIPPSINMIIYGAITSTSIGALFAAGFVPGLLLAAMFSGLIVVAAILKPSIVGRREAAPPLRERIGRLKDLLPPVFIFLTVMGSIYAGWATPTEAAAVGVVASFVLVAATGNLSLVMLKQSLLATTSVSAMMLLILIAAFYLNFIIGVLGVPAMVSGFIAGFDVAAWQMILLLTILYLILGCFMDSLAMMIATIPIVMPVVTSLGYDPVWFGIYLVIMCELALITPPVGMNLYVVQGVRGQGTVAEVISGVTPFLICLLGLTALITAFPEIVMWLPHMQGR